MEKSEFDHPFFKDTEKFMKRQHIKMIIAALVMIFCFAFVMVSFHNAVEEKKDIYSNNVGKHIVLDKDTVQILDYSMFKGNYTLSNGKEISFELFEKLKTIE